MRVIVVAGGSLATAYALVPLTTAIRDAGHEVVMVANDDVVPAVTGSGLPAVSVSSVPIATFVYHGRDGRPVTIPRGPADEIHFTGRWFGRMAAQWLPGLTALAADWRPDVVIGGTLSYAGALLAARLGVPYVRHTWDAIDSSAVDAGAVEDLGPELAALGLTGIPPADLLVDVSPPSLAPPRLPARAFTPLRWIPVTGQRPLEPWMYTRPGKPRICLTTGSRVVHDAPAGDFRRAAYELLGGLISAVRSLDVDVVVATPDATGAALRADWPALHAGWFPLDVVARTCDLIVHHGGGTTALTGLVGGTPQVMVPQGALPELGTRRVAETGAGISLPRGDDSAESVVAAVKQVLGDARYAAAARSLAAEIAAQPNPAQVVDQVAALAAGTFAYTVPRCLS
jgi:D-olivosyltransferase